ncbi:MAG: hypothetical protein AAGF88_08835 [Pseudomonadota bacterium]
MRIAAGALAILSPLGAGAAEIDCSFHAICRGEAPCIASSGLLTQLDVIDDLSVLSFADDILRITGPEVATGQQFTSAAQEAGGQTAIILSRRPDGTAALTIHVLSDALFVETFFGTCEAPT